MIARLACAVIIVGTAVTGCGGFGQAERAEPPSTSIVDTPNGDLEVITVPGFDNPPPANEFETPELSGDPVVDYLAYSGPTNLPFIQIDNGSLIGLDINAKYSMNASYTYAVSDPTDKSLDDRLDEIVDSMTQKYPDLTPEIGREETHSETRDYYDSRSTTLSAPNQANIEDIYINVTADSRYPNIKFVYLSLQMPDGTLPDPLPTGSAVDTMIGPLRDAAGLTNNDITDLRVYLGWELTYTDVGGVGMAYQPLATQITMNAGAASPEQVQATLQPLLDSDWKQDRVGVMILPNSSDPDTTDIFYRIRRPGEL